MAFLPFEQVYGSSSSGTYQHMPDPTAKDPESGKQQFVCASARLPVLLACPCIKLMLPAPHLYSRAQVHTRLWPLIQGPLHVQQPRSCNSAVWSGLVWSCAVSSRLVWARLDPHLPLRSSGFS
jgi:hypothetical protein